MPQNSNLPARRKGLYRYPDHGQIGGVCVGLEQYTGIPATFWRIGFLAAFFGYGTGIGVYLIMMLAMDAVVEVEEPEPQRALTSEEDEILAAVKKEMRELDLS